MGKVIVIGAVLTIVLGVWASAKLTGEGTLSDAAIRAASLALPTLATESVTVEMAGSNGRGYVFDAPKSKGHSCIAVVTSRGTGVSCYPKGDVK